MKFVVGAVVSLLGCSPAGGDIASRNAELPPGSCLELVWEHQDNRDIAFDISNDRVGEHIISCATLTSASQFREALRRMKALAVGKEVDRLLDKVYYPLIFIDRDGSKTVFRNKVELQENRHKVFSHEVMKLFQNLSLADMEVVTGKGAFFRSGALWLGAAQIGEEPRIMTINLEALGKSVQPNAATS